MTCRRWRGPAARRASRRPERDARGNTPAPRDRGEDPMYRHSPSCLAGPVSRTRDWWLGHAPGAKRPPGRQPVEREAAPAPARPFRSELVERVRREIAEGVYDTPQKWQAALDRLLDGLGG